MIESDPKARSLGYARVSTYGQTLDAQLEQLRKEGCSKIYCEKASGAQPKRRELQRLLKAVAPGDVVTVTREAFPAVPRRLQQTRASRSKGFLFERTSRCVAATPKPCGASTLCQ